MINKIIFVLSIINLHAYDVENLINLCDDNQASSCRELAVEYIQQDDLLENADNIEIVLNLYHKACDMEDKEACLHLRTLYYYDNNEINKTKYTLNKLKKRVPLERVFNNLGCLYGNGDLIVHINYNKAFELFKLVCNNYDGNGCYNLGLMYEQGQAVEKNYNKALELYKKSCKLGYKNACFLAPKKLKL